MRYEELRKPTFLQCAALYRKSLYFALQKCIAIGLLKAIGFRNKNLNVLFLTFGVVTRNCAGKSAGPDQVSSWTFFDPDDRTLRAVMPNWIGEGAVTSNVPYSEARPCPTGRLEYPRIFMIVECSG